MHVLVPSALLLATLTVAVLLGRRSRVRGAPVRLRVIPYRSDRAGPQAVAAFYAAVHKRLLRRWWQRLWGGQPGIALEIHLRSTGGAPEATLALVCPAGMERTLRAALRGAYPDVRLTAWPGAVGRPGSVVRLRKRDGSGRRINDPRGLEQRDPPIDGVLLAMAAAGAPTLVQVAIRPVPLLFERIVGGRPHHAELARPEHGGPRVPRANADELRTDIARGPLFFCEIRVAASDRRHATQVSSELRSVATENALVERGTAVRRALMGRWWDRRIQTGALRGIPDVRGGTFGCTELPSLWQVPSVGFRGVPLARTSVPFAPAPAATWRPRSATGLMRDAWGPVSIQPALRRQHVAVPGAVDQGKSSLLVASVAEDLQRRRCAVIVLDPKGDAADAAISLVPPGRALTLLDLARPTCGFNPLAVDAPPDVIADYVVGALRPLFGEGDIRASSDRYLRSATVAALACDRDSTLWDVARLLSVGRDGQAFREHVGTRLRTLPEFGETARFFDDELGTQLEQARSTTTSKLDAPANKLARLLNSPSIKRVLLNRSLVLDLDRIIADAEVLVVRGALGAMGAGNTAVVLQLLVGMLDAALARQQDLVPADERIAVALKIDEAPLVINRGFASTLALKRSAGLETVACWQTDAQWEDDDLRAQLDALFAHRVYFATASVPDARAGAALMMAEFTDQVRAEDGRVSMLARPDTRLHLPRHHAIVSWTGPSGRLAPFVAQTIPMHVDDDLLAHHAARQARRGGRVLEDLSQPHWERVTPNGRPTSAVSPATAPPPPATAPPPPATAPPPPTTAPPPPTTAPPPPTTAPPPPTTAPPPPTTAPPPPATAPRLPVAALQPPAAPRTGPAPATSPPRPAAPSPPHATPAPRHATPSPPPAMPSPRAESPSPPPAPRRATPSPPPAMPSPRAESPSPPHETPSPPHETPSPPHETPSPVLATPGSPASNPETPSSPGAGASPRVRASGGESRRRRPAPEALRELAQLDSARELRPIAAADPEVEPRLDAIDVEMLVWLAGVGHALSTQLHRRFGAGRSLSTTQRRLRRLYEGGVVARWQPHRGDGGALPVVYALTPAGRRVLLERRRIRLFERESAPASDGTDGRWRAEVRRDIHLAAWLAGLEATLHTPLRILGRDEAVAHPPRRPHGSGDGSVGPGDLARGDGRVAHDFLRSDRDGRRGPARTFETVRPDCLVRAARAEKDGPELMVELDLRSASRFAAARLERYDHLLTGWWSLRHPARRRPNVVFVLRDRGDALRVCALADRVVGACMAYPGEHPRDWEYPGRAAMSFCAEEDVHHGTARSWQIRRLPPSLRSDRDGVVEAELALKPA
ncbi:MAG TPA: replication-relaxation family protein [Solirubrobacteraceae bacterium]|nr:replication-relaxation family protein [Solirubrobacteraceae bacterium]